MIILCCIVLALSVGATGAPLEGSTVAEPLAVPAPLSVALAATEENTAANAPAPNAPSSNHDSNSNDIDKPGTASADPPSFEDPTKPPAVRTSPLSWSTSRCTPWRENRTCIYTDVLMMNGKLYLQLPTGAPNPESVPRVSNVPKHTSWNFFEPMYFNSAKERHRFLTRDFKYGPVVAPAEVAIMHGCYMGNAGHMLMDCLYATFVALTQFYPPETQFLSLIEHMRQEGCDYYNKACHQTEQQMGAFAGFGIMAFQQYKNFSRPFLFRNVIIGVRNLGVLGFYPDMQLAHGVNPSISSDMLRMFRDRVYRSQGLPPPLPLPLPTSVFTMQQDQQQVHQQGPNSSFQVNARIFANKRYTKDEKRQMEAAVLDLRRANPNLDIKYQPWGMSFKQQLLLFSTLAIYITGPGTGLIAHVLLPDGSVVVNLGGLQADCRSPNRTVPTFMESHLAASAWRYQKALYYPSSTRHLGIRTSEFTYLISQAYNAVGRTAELNKSPRDNLPPEAQIAYDLCTEAGDPCREHFVMRNIMVDMRDLLPTHPDLQGWHNFKYGCGMFRWIEHAVYEICPYDPEGFQLDHPRNKPSDPPLILTTRCAGLPVDKLRALRASPEFRDRLAPYSPDSDTRVIRPVVIIVD